MKRFVLLLSLLFLGTLNACAVMEPEFSGPKVWTVSAMERVKQGQWADLDEKVISELFAARNETEAFQLIVRAPRSGLQNTSITISPFVNEAGESLSDVSLYRAHYVYVGRVSRQGSAFDRNPSQGVGWYADALIPFDSQAPDPNLRAQPFTLGAARNQPIWVDVHVPEDASPGVYTSRYTVSSNEGSESGEIRLTVWDFALPKSPALYSSFLVWTQQPIETFRMLTAHRIMAAHNPPEFQRELIDDYGLSSSDLLFWSGANYETCSMRPAPTLEEIRSRFERYQKDILIYNYTADEVWDCADQLAPQLKAWSRNFHEVGVKQLVTILPTPSLYDNGTGRSAVDIWVASPRMFMEDPDSYRRVREAQTRGEEVWGYTALSWHDHIPKWGVDFHPMNYRILPGFMNHSYGLTGYLYWRVEDWNNTPWTNISHRRSDYPTGEGMLVYPGQNLGLSGVVPSMRLKWIRQGVNDYDYVQLLKDLGQEAQALAITRKVAENWERWSQDYESILSAKQELAALILKYQ